MTRRKRRYHSSAFKAEVSLASVKDENTLAELAEQFDIHPNQIQDWKKRLAQGAEDLFGGNADEARRNKQAVEKLHTKLPLGNFARFFVLRRCSDKESYFNYKELQNFSHGNQPSRLAGQRSTA